MADNSEKIKLLTDLYNKGQIPDDIYKNTLDKLKTVSKDLRPEVTNRASTLSELIPKLVESGKAVNLESVVKNAGSSPIGIDPSVRNKELFGNINKRLSEAGHVASEESGLLKNAKGFSKVLPAFGLGAAALAGLGIANKVQAGEFGEAGLETADLATDYVPVLGQVKFAARPSELGNAELPEDEMQARAVFNAARQGKFGEKVNNPSTETPLLEPEGRAKYEDMQSQFKNIMDRLNKK